MSNYTEVITALEKGRFLEEVDQRLTELVKQVAALERGGEITLKLKLAPIKGCDQVFITPDCTVKTPRAPKTNNLFFWGLGGELSRSPLNQLELLPDEDSANEVAMMRRVK